MTSKIEYPGIVFSQVNSLSLIHIYILAANMNAFYGRGYGSGYYMFDWTYLLVLIGLALSLIASANVKNTFNHYTKIRSRSNLTGAMAAERVLHRAGIYDVSIQRVAGNLTDHYDPRSKTLRLSDSTCLLYTSRCV